MTEKIIALGLLVVLVSALMLVPACTAAVYITPMKITAYGNVSILGPEKVEKVIFFRNDGNESVIISLNTTGSEVDISLTKNEFELGAGEEKAIYPIMKVEEGRHEGVIRMVAREKGEIEAGTGAAVFSRMSISVTTIGTQVSPPVAVIAIPVAVVAAAIIGYLIYRRRRKK